MIFRISYLAILVGLGGRTATQTDWNQKSILRGKIPVNDRIPVSLTIPDIRPM